MMPLFIYIKTNRKTNNYFSQAAGSLWPLHICAGARVAVEQHFSGDSVIVLHSLEILNRQGVTSVHRLWGDQGTRVLTSDNVGADI